MGKEETASSCLVTKAYLWIWAVSILLPWLDGHFFGNGAGGLDARPLTENDHTLLFPLVYLLLYSLLLQASLRLTVALGCAAHLVDLVIRWQRMPVVWDHEQWAMQIELTFLLLYLPTLLLSLPMTTTENALRRTAQCQLVLFYAAATFWKFNTSFFDTRVSCGTVLILEALTTYLPSALLTPTVTVRFGQLAPHLTGVMEGAIAALLSVHRHAAVVLATLFHLTIFLLPVNAAGGFSMDCNTRFILLFTTADLQHYQSHARVVPEVLLVAVASAALVGIRQHCTGTPFDFGFAGMCCLTTLYLRLVAFGATGETQPSSTTTTTPRPSLLHKATMAGMVLLAIGYGFVTVILGIQHMGAPTMYSNLRYYGGGNHFLVPVSILPDDIIYGGGLVQVWESTLAALNRRLAYIPSEDVFPSNVLEKIRVATGEATTWPVQFFPLCLSNPHSRALLAGEYEPANPPGSTNFVPFILPISDLRKALREHSVEEEPSSSSSSYTVKFVYAGTSNELQDHGRTTPDRMVVLTESSCEIQSADGEKVDECDADPAVQLMRNPPTDFAWLQWLVSKLQTPYPQLAGLTEEICMS